MFEILCPKNKNKEWGKTNKVYIVDPANGKRDLVTSNGVISGLSIEFVKSTNNVIEFEQPFHFVNSRLILSGDSNKVHIKSNSNCCSSYISLNGACLNIGKNFTMGYEARLYVGRYDLSIGDNCLLDKHACIYNEDFNSIYDIESKECVNYSTATVSNIQIGNYVWIGDSAMLLKDARVKDHTIIMPKSLLNIDVKESKVMLLGNPASIVKRGVTWTKGQHFYFYEDALK